jgi:hypothetical protein
MLQRSIAATADSKLSPGSKTLVSYERPAVAGFQLWRDPEVLDRARRSMRRLLQQ